MESNSLSVGSAKRFSLKSVLSLIAFIALCLALLTLFLKLGFWQVERLHWKEDLLQKVHQRIKHEFSSPPLKTDWSKMNEDDYAYLPVKIRGYFLTKDNLFVTSMNDETTGFWWMSPFKTEAGDIIFVNRGFLTQDQYQNKVYQKDLKSKQKVEVLGLLRLSETDGHFVHKNDSEKNIWYNRTIPEMTKALNFPKEDVAPYFIDAFKISEQNVGVLGLTRLNFPNNHLSYAITWFCLAAFVFGALCYILYDFFKKRFPKSIVGKD